MVPLYCLRVSRTSLVLLLSLSICMALVFQDRHKLVGRPSTVSMRMSKLSREDEIKQKIMRLKRAGKIRSNGGSVSSDSFSPYEDRIKEKLGTKKSKLMGFADGDDDDDDDGANDIVRIQAELDDETPSGKVPEPRGRLGSLQNEFVQEDSLNEPDSSSRPLPQNEKKVYIDPSLFGESQEPEMSEEELVDLVVARLDEKRNEEQKIATDTKSPIPLSQEKITSGVGGTWQGEGNTTELYRPKSGSWGAFPRPRDISKAYGGGRRVGAGFSNEDDVVSDLNTKNLLKDYRRKVGIDVPSEREHASEIEEALHISQLAMQRGIYDTAVSALEKVTQWCSTNSKVGSKVFLELAMAYEAVGRAKEAYQVYKTLTTCRMEDVKHHANRLIYGLEAMEIMRDVSSEFSRQQIRNTFIDTTGLGNIAQNFDDVYNTAYVDLDNGYYRRLTESVVRSNREARQILLKAKGKGEVGRMKVIQALRSMARHFDDNLEVEVSSKKTREPTAYINGKPLMAGMESKVDASAVQNIDDFALADPDQMLKNLDGSWRLQLLADKQGDGVTYFNTTDATQEFSTASMMFSASGPASLSTSTSSGNIEFDGSKRIITRCEVQTSGGVSSFLGIFGGKDSGFPGAVSRKQQIVSVDSVLLVTKSPPGSRKGRDAEKEHFGVWRRAQTN